MRVTKGGGGFTCGGDKDLSLDDFGEVDWSSSFFFSSLGALTENGEAADSHFGFGDRGGEEFVDRSESLASVSDGFEVEFGDDKGFGVS